MATFLVIGFCLAFGVWGVWFSMRDAFAQAATQQIPPVTDLAGSARDGYAVEFRWTALDDRQFSRLLKEQ